MVHLRPHILQSDQQCTAPIGNVPQRGGQSVSPLSLEWGGVPKSQPCSFPHLSFRSELWSPRSGSRKWC